MAEDKLSPLNPTRFKEITDLTVYLVETYASSEDDKTLKDCIDDYMVAREDAILEEIPDDYHQ